MPSDRIAQAAILRVGGAPDPDLGPVGWHFDCRGAIPARAIDEDGERRWGGYTLDDLWDVWAHLNRN